MGPVLVICWKRQDVNRIMKSLSGLFILLFIFQVFGDFASLYEIDNNTSSQTHHLGFSSIDLENNEDVNQDSEIPEPSYGAPAPEAGYGAPSPPYGDLKPGGDNTYAWFTSLMQTDMFADFVPEEADFQTTMELKFQEFLSELNEPCKLADFFQVKHLFLRCDPPSKLITLDINGDKDVLITMKTLTRIKGSKLAEYFQNNVTENDQIMDDLPIVEEIPGKRYFIDRMTVMTQALIEFLKSPNYCIGKNSGYGYSNSYVSPNSFKAELFMYGIFDEKDDKSFGHYRISKNVQDETVCFEWNVDYLK